MKKRHLFKTIIALLIASVTLSGCDEVISAIDTWFEEVGDTLEDTAQKVEDAVPDEIKDGIHDVGDKIGDAVGDAVDAVYNWGKDTFNYIGSGEFGRDFVTFSTSAYNKAKDYIVTNGRKVGDFFTGVKDNMLAFFLADGVNSLDLKKKNPTIYGWEDYAEDPETVAIGMVTRYLGQKYNVFYGVIDTEDYGSLYGLAYTDYENPYVNSETGVSTYNTGFIAFNSECTIPEAIRDDGLIIYNLEEEKDGIQYVYSLEIEPYKTHLISGEKYIVFGIDETQTLFFETPDEVDESLGGLYSFKEERFVSGSENDYVVTDSVLDVDPTSKATIKKVLETMSSGFAIDLTSIYGYIENAITSVKNVLYNLEDQTILGYKPQQIKNVLNQMGSWIPKDIICIKNNTLELAASTPEGSPTNTVKWMIGIATLIIFIANLVIQTIGNKIKTTHPAIAVLIKGASGAVTAAMMDIFVDTVIHSKSFSEINWNKILISAISGAISSFTGVLGDAVVAGVTNAIFSLMDGESILNVALSFVSGFVISLALSAIISVLMKPIEAIVSKIARSIKIRQLKKEIIAQFGDMVDDQTATEIACTRYATKAVGDGTTDSLLTGVDEVRKKFYGQLPADDNLNIGLIDDAGSFISKNAYFESNSKVAKLALKDTASDEFKAVWKKCLGSLDATLDVINGEINFRKVALAVVDFPERVISTEREKTNFKIFDKALANKWTDNPSEIPQEAMDFFLKHGKDPLVEGLEDTDIRLLRTSLKYTIHETAEGTMMLVPAALHAKLSHAGGVALTKYLISTSSYYQKIIKGAIA